jgi:hypothetical protein
MIPCSHPECDGQCHSWRRDLHRFRGDGPVSQPDVWNVPGHGISRGIWLHSLSVYVDRDQAVTLYLRSIRRTADYWSVHLTVFVKDYDPMQPSWMRRSCHPWRWNRNWFRRDGPVSQLTAGTYQVTASAEEYDSSSPSVYVDRTGGHALSEKAFWRTSIGDKYRLVVYVKDYDSWFIFRMQPYRCLPWIRLLTNEDEEQSDMWTWLQGLPGRANKTGYLGAQSSITHHRDQMLVLYLKQLPAPTPTPTPEPHHTPGRMDGARLLRDMAWKNIIGSFTKSLSTDPTGLSHQLLQLLRIILNRYDSVSICATELGGRYESRGSMSSSGSDSENGNGTIPDTNEPQHQRMDQPPIPPRFRNWWQMRLTWFWFKLSNETGTEPQGLWPPRLISQYLQGWLWGW